MKGVVFTEFLEMVEDKFGLSVVDKIVQASDLENDGAYTAVGTYDYRDLLQLVTHLSEEVGVPIPELVRSFGFYLFGRFVKSYPFFLNGVTNASEFLANVESIIHVEVRKLYPDAELPSIGFAAKDDGGWTLHYRSNRPFADLCEGLIAACIEQFGEKGVLEREDQESSEQGFATIFSFQCK